MKKIVFVIFLSVMVLCAFQTKAQVVTTSLVHAGATTVYYGYNSFVEAYTAAINGDQLYLSPGGFGIVTIAKRLTIIGAGHAPDSIGVPKRTFYNGIMTLTTGSDSSYIEGLYINGNFLLNGAGSVDSVTLQRCFVNGNVLLEASSTATAKDYITVRENIIAGCVNGYNFGTGLVLSHNFISGANYFSHYQRAAIISIPGNALIEGNIITYGDVNWELLYNVDNSLIQNNIIFVNSYSNFEDECQNSTFRNNLSIHGAYTSAINTVANNYFSVVRDSIFVNQTSYAFDYTNNYHLKHPETYLGSDNTEVGFYGGEMPFKEDMLPSNPQILYKKVDNRTDADGKLKIKYSVESQQY